MAVGGKKSSTPGVRFLGRGGFGEVWEAVGPDGVAKAVKLCPLSDRVSLAREWAGLVAMQRVRHRGLIHIDYFYICNNRLVVVMELAG